MLVADAINAMSSPNRASSKLEKTIARSHLGGRFTGSAETLMDILNPHVTNWLKNRTGNLKRRLTAAEVLVCGHSACITSKGPLDTAHPPDNDRPNVIRAAIAETCAVEDSINGKVVQDCDIAAVLVRAKENHEKLLFSFLCNPCNKRHSSIATPIVSKTISEWGKYADEEMSKARASRARQLSKAVQPD